MVSTSHKEHYVISNLPVNLENFELQIHEGIERAEIEHKR